MEEVSAEKLANEVRLYSVLVGVLLILVFVVPCVVFALVAKCFQKQTNRKQSTLRTMMSGSIRMTENFGTTIGNGSRDNMLDSTGSNYGVFGQIEYPVDRIRLVEVMVSVKSSLACLEVWKAYAPAMLYSGDEDKLVAVKKLNPSAHTSRHQKLQGGRAEMLSHANCLKTELCSYSNLMPHPHLLNLLGVTTTAGSPTSLILECPLYGSLHAFLICKRRGHIADNAHQWAGLNSEGADGELLMAVVGGEGGEGHPVSALLDDPFVARRPFEMPLNERFTEEDELLFALQIASGMEALINCGILHKRLSSENIFISGGFKLKISGMDFDSPSVHRSSTISMLKRTASGRNLLKWDAPEVIEGREYSDKSEVWRYAMTLWEISSLGDTPFAEIPNRALTELLKRKEVPQRPEGCPSELYALMMRCWSTQTYSRPNFSEITTTITDMMEPPRHKTSSSSSDHDHSPPLPSLSPLMYEDSPGYLSGGTRLIVTPPPSNDRPAPDPPHPPRPHHPHAFRNLIQRQRRPSPANHYSSFCSPLVPTLSPEALSSSPKGSYNETAV